MNNKKPNNFSTKMLMKFCKIIRESQNIQWLMDHVHSQSKDLLVRTPTICLKLMILTFGILY
jgi:hypothetical protein